jgi:hypothetical protein
MKDVFIAYGVILWIVNIIFCAWLANQKNRNVGTWVFLSLLFPGLAIIAIAGATPERTIEGQVIGHHFKCPFCSYECDNTGSILNHIKHDHPEKIPESFSETKCPICGWECDNQESLENHIKYVHSMK